MRRAATGGCGDGDGLGIGRFMMIAAAIQLAMTSCAPT